MRTAKEFYKEQHPEQFSDSKIISKAKLNREFFEYFLSTLTSRSQEKDFERFCKALAEKELCPNLIIQTGPTGGGDSKVDTETYPVSDAISLSWYSGIGREASNERWAFAISTKHEWKAKVKSDVKNIISTDREYKLIYFMSSQFISDKKRAEVEDELKNEYSITVRILDKSWIVEKIFEHSHQNIAIEHLHISDSFLDEVDIGPMDFKRKKELDEIESLLPDYISSGQYAKCIESAMRSYILSRELECPESDTVGRLYRAHELIKKYGLASQEKECLYDWAWTLYWWYDNYDAFYVKYCKYEALIDNQPLMLNDIETLFTLWMNLFVILQNEPNKKDFKEHTQKLKNFFESIINDKTRSNQLLQAKAKYTIMRLFLGEKIDKLVDELIDILKMCDNSYEFDFFTMQRIITQTAIYQKSVRYDELFEIIISISEKRKKELEAARLLRIRAEQLTQSKPYDAIRYYGRALTKLIKCESKHDLVDVLFSMGILFEKVGLFWASRGYCLNALQIAMNHYFGYGETYISLIGALEKLKNLEMLMGRIMYSVEFHHFEQIAISLFLLEYPDSNLKNVIKENSLYIYDAILGIQIFKTEFSNLDDIELIPDYANENGLQFSSIAAKYALGYVDDKFKKNFISKSNFDDFIKCWYNQPARTQLVGLPWYGTNEFYILKSQIIGCCISINAENKFPCIELGESILASIESFLATGFEDGLFSKISDINVKIKHMESNDYELRYEHINNAAIPTYIIYTSNYPESCSLETQMETKEFILKISIHIISNMLYYELSKHKLEDMAKNDEVFDRAISFTNSIQVIKNFFGSTLNVKILDGKYRRYSIKRIAPLKITNELLEFSEYSKSVKEKWFMDLNQLKQSNIKTASTINVTLWDAAKWRGVAFIYDYGINLMLLPVFENISAGKQIFEQWIKEIGNDDTEDYIKIGIIKGINKEYPCHYRVVFSPNIDTLIKDNQCKCIINQCRFHTMEVNNNRNIKMFEEIYKKLKTYWIYPVEIKNNELIPNDLFRIRKTSIEIKEAWEIDETSFMSNAILPSDNPIIPSNISDVPIFNVFKRIKESQKL